MKVKALILESESNGVMVDGKIEDGRLYVGDKLFFIDLNKTKISPIYIKKFFGYMPLYILKCDSLIPISFETESKKIKLKDVVLIKKEIKPAELKYVRTELPKLIKDSFELEFVKNFAQYKVKKKMSLGNIPFILLIIGTFAISYFIVFSLM